MDFFAAWGEASELCEDSSSVRSGTRPRLLLLLMSSAGLLPGGLARSLSARPRRRALTSDDRRTFTGNQCAWTSASWAGEALFSGGHDVPTNPPQPILTARKTRLLAAVVPCPEGCYTRPTGALGVFRHLLAQSQKTCFCKKHDVLNIRAKNFLKVCPQFSKILAIWMGWIRGNIAV